MDKLPVPDCVKTESETVGGSEATNMDSVYVLDGIPACSEVKGEAEDCIDAAEGFRADPEEENKGRVSENIAKVKLEQDEEASGRGPGCEEDVASTGELSMAELSQGRRHSSQVGQLPTQIYNQDQPGMSMEAAHASQVSWLTYDQESDSVCRGDDKGARSVEGTLGHWGRSARELRIRHFLEELEAGTAAGADLAVSEQSSKTWAASDSHLDGVNVGRQENELMDPQEPGKSDGAQVDGKLSHPDVQVTADSDSSECQNISRSELSSVDMKEEDCSSVTRCQKSKASGEISDQLLGEHLDIISGEEVFDCSVCQRICPNESSLHEHMKDHADQKLFECSLCGKKLSNKYDLKLHLKVHCGEKQFECSVCKRKFYYRSFLAHHMKIHSGEKPYECNVCGKNFRERWQLRRHMISNHTDERPFQCNECRKVFSNTTALNRHMKGHSDEKLFDCSVCGKKFNQKNHLHEHLKSHTGEKPFECDVCKKKFSYKKSFSLHMMTHTGERPFNCDVCGKKYKERWQVVQHKTSSHTDERPFQCNECGKSFANRTALKHHMKVHFGIKRFNCTVCEKKCNSKHHLLEHMRTHTGEKPFECAVCREKFAYKSSLNRHMLTHTGEEPFDCSVCEKQLTGKSDLLQHMKSHTGDFLE